MSSSSVQSVQVFVRIRPLSNREILRNTSICVNLDKETQTKLTILKSNNSLPSSSSPPIISTTDENSNNSSKRTFVYDRCFDSIDENNENFAGQETVFETIGKRLLEHAFDGYNVCLFAYGQTGSGKSYTMMGFNGAQGVIPRACNYLFERLYKEQENDPDLSINIEVSYLEIYCEKVRDLLNPNNKANLRVREHPIMGPYVEDLARLIVSDYSEISNLIDEGNKSRTVAATNMNEISSRSHAVFQLILTQKRYDKETNLTTEKVSRISFVDLAGSERANSTGATGLRLKEGGQINKSLTTLGKVISALAERASPRKSVKKGSAEVFVPYRDSVLTWLLKDSLGGNSKTAMISCISPSDLHYEETLSTLRYSDRAKKIMNLAVVNEDPNAKLIRELKEEIAILKQQLALREENGDVDDDQDQEEEDMSHAELLALQDRLGESEKLMSQLNETWEDKLRKTQEIALEREKALEELGITLSKTSTGAVGVYTPKWPHLVNLNEDPLMSECLIYQLRPGRVTIGKTSHSDDLHNGKDLPQIVLSGENILDEHCFVVNEEGIVSITPLHGSLTFVNGHKIDAFTVLKSGDRIRLGDNHRFRFNNPEEVRKERARSSSSSILNSNVASNEKLNDEVSVNSDKPPSISSSPTSSSPKYFSHSYESQSNASFSSEMFLASSRDLSPAKSSRSIIPDDFIDEIIQKEREKLQKQFSKEKLNIQMELEQARAEMERLKLLAQSNGTLNSEKSTDGKEDSSATAEESGSTELPTAEESRECRSSTRTFSKLTFSNRRSASEAELAKYVLHHWKWRIRNVALMRSVQHHIPIIKESNIIAKELSKSVMYQLTILSSSIYYTPPNQTNSLTSFWESSSSVNLHSSSSSSSSSSSQSISSSVSSSLTSDDIPTLLSSNTHILAVKVYDISTKKIYYHSLPDFKKRLIQMRNQYNLLTKPNLKVHFQDYDPFIDTLESKKEYQLLGFSRLPLLSLFNDHSSPSFTNTIVANKPVKLSIPIIQNGTGDLTGWLNVVVTVLKPNLKQSLSSSSLSSSSLSKAIQESEQTVLMDVRIDSAHGVSKNWTQLHVQFRVPEWSGRMGSTSGSISSIKEIVELGDGLNKLRVEDGHEDEEMKVYATDLMEVNDEGVVFWRFNQTVKIVGKEVNPKLLRWLENGLVFEVWGKSESDVREDAKSEMKSYERYVTPAPSLISPEKRSYLQIASTPQLSKATGSQLSSSKHEFISYMSISELSPSGMYEPVNIQLDPSLASHHGTFILQQGVQRRMNLSFEVIFSSSLTTVFQLNTVKDIILSEVRLLDNKNRIVSSSSSTSPSSLSPSQNASHKKTSSVPVILPVQPNNIVVSTNQAGRQILQVRVPWDSSLHDSVHFNTVTPSNCKVLFNISVALGVTHRSLASSSTGSLPEEEISDEEDKNKEESREEEQEKEQDEEITLSWDCECQIYNRFVRDSSKKSLGLGMKSLSGLLGLSNSHKPLLKRTSKFWNVTVTPKHQLLQSLNEQSREREYVRGEEVLSANGFVLVGGKDRGAGMITRCLRAEEKLRLLGDVVEAKIEIEKVKDWRLGGESGIHERIGEEEMEKIVELWKGSKKKILSAVDRLKLMRTPATSVVPVTRKKVEQIIQVRETVKPSKTAKSGYILRYDSQDDAWIKSFFVIKRPYLFMYDTATDAEETGVVPLSQIKVITNMMDPESGQYVFSIVLAHQKDVILQVSSEEELQQWITALDPLQSGAMLSKKNSRVSLKRELQLRGAG